MDSFAELTRSLITTAKKKKLKIAVAESVTGGMISAAITAISGASEVFVAGIVAYDENVKIHALGVDRKEIHESHGYSVKTAEQMAERVLMRNGADIAISTTGCAGPEHIKGFERGRVLFGLARKGKKTVVFDERFGEGREEVRKKATEFALEQLLKFLK